MARACWCNCNRRCVSLGIYSRGELAFNRLVPEHQIRGLEVMKQIEEERTGELGS